MAESPDWRTRLTEARQRMVFEPTPTGATPYVSTVERLAEALDGVEVAVAASPTSGAAVTLGGALALLLREAINSRMYERNLRGRFENQPSEIDQLIQRVTELLESKRV